MGPAPKCPICLSLYFGPKKPITLTCGHTLCKEDLENLIRTKAQVKCPLCVRYYDERESRALSNILPNISIQDLMEKIQTKCLTHEDFADRVCLKHAQALCPDCHDHDACQPTDIAEDFDIIQRELEKMTRKLSKKNPSSLPERLSKDIKVAMRKNLNDLLKLYREVYGHINGIDTSDPRKAMLDEGQKDLRIIHSCLLPPDLLARWRSPPPSLPECSNLVREIHRFVGAVLENEDSLPDLVCCVNCLKAVPKTNMDMLKLPCHQVYHVICRGCAQEQVACGQVICKLDERTFQIDNIDRLPVFTPPPSIKDGTRLSAYPSKVFFGYEHFVDLFKHVMPSEKLPPKLREGIRKGYTIDFSANQVEAISFCCFTDAVIGGIGFANPVDAGDSATIEWVKIYAGQTALGLPRLQTAAFPRELTGASGVLTNLLFQEEFPITATNYYTIKVKLTGQKPDNKMLFYRGNHLTRWESPTGSRENPQKGIGDTWEFVLTEGADKGEKCTGQHFVTGPILRILYR